MSLELMEESVTQIIIDMVRDNRYSVKQNTLYFIPLSPPPPEAYQKNNKMNQLADRIFEINFVQAFKKVLQCKQTLI